MNASVRALLASTRETAQSPHSTTTSHSHTDPLPTFMHEPVASEPLENSHSRKRAVVRIGGLTLGIFAAVLVVFSTISPDTARNMIGALDSLLGQAFAADLSANNSGDSTLPIAIYPEQTQNAPQSNPTETTMTAEELKQKMHALREEMEAMEQQGYGRIDEINLSETITKDNNSLMMTETLSENAVSENMASENVVAAPANIANPLWEEPLTPPRWGDDRNREGIVVPLDRPQQTAWLATPQWQRTENQPPKNAPSISNAQYDNVANNDNAINAQAPHHHFRIQLGSFRSSGSAESGWRQLLSQNRDIFGVLDHSVEQANLGSRGIYYRLQAGSFANADVAKVLCDEVKARNGDCLVVRR